MRMIMNYIDFDEAWTFGENTEKLKEITDIAKQSRYECQITLDDDSTVYRMWELDDADDYEFDALDNDMADLGASYSMYYLKTHEEWKHI